MKNKKDAKLMLVGTYVLEETKELLEKKSGPFSVSQILRGLIDGYMEGRFELTMDDMTKAKRP